MSLTNWHRPLNTLREKWCFPANNKGERIRASILYGRHDTSDRLRKIPQEKMNALLKDLLREMRLSLKELYD